MAIVKPEYIADLQKSQDLKFWRILDSSGKLELNRCLQDIGLDASIDMLQKDLENTSGDFVVVKLYSQKPTYKETGTVQETAIVRKVSLSPTIGKAHSNSYGSSNNDMIYLLMKESRNSEMQYLNQLQELKMELLEMKMNENKQEHILLQLIKDPSIQVLLANKFLGGGSAPTKAPKISEPFTESDSERLAGVLDRFASLDPDYINTLEKMAKKVEERPAILTALKSSFDE
jgi:hypothetical protein